MSAVSCGQQEVISPVDDLTQISSAKKTPKVKNGELVPGEFLVKFKTTSKTSVGILSTVGATKVREVGKTGVQLIRIEGTNALSTNEKSLKSKLGNNIEWIEQNRYIVLTDKNPQAYIPSKDEGESFPNDPMFKDQYAHKVSNSMEGWKISKGNSDFIVAIVDTGVDGTHPDLKAKLVPGFDVYNPDTPDSAYKDPQGHGTHCAGIAAAIGNNKTGVIGFAPDVKIQAVRVLGDDGSGTYEGVAQGIAWAAEHGAKVMSMSLGGPSSSEAIEEAIKLALKNDVLPIAAMGNDGDDSLSYPASIKGVMSVGATDSKDKIASFSQYGKHISVSAPGVNILSTFPMYDSGMPSKEYGKISGTSMATPAVSGLAALVRSKFPNLKAEQVREKIEKSCDDLGTPGFDIHYGHGRINVGKALK